MAHDGHQCLTIKIDKSTKGQIQMVPGVILLGNRTIHFVITHTVTLLPTHPESSRISNVCEEKNPPIDNLTSMCEHRQGRIFA